MKIEDILNKPIRNTQNGEILKIIDFKDTKGIIERNNSGAVNRSISQSNLNKNFHEGLWKFINTQPKYIIYE